MTPREFSSGNSRHLGGISKRGDRYLRVLLTHGARSVLRAASVAQHQGKSVSGLRQWSLAVQSAAITTRRPVRWPTRSREFATRRCAMVSTIAIWAQTPNARRDPSGNLTARALRCQAEPLVRVYPPRGARWFDEGQPRRRTVDKPGAAAPMEPPSPRNPFTVPRSRYPALFERLIALHGFTGNTPERDLPITPLATIRRLPL